MKENCNRQLLTAGGSLDVETTDIFRPLSKPSLVSQYVDIMTNFYFSPTCATLTWKLKSTHPETIFLDSKVFSYGIPFYVLTEDSPRLVTNIFQRIWLLS